MVIRCNKYKDLYLEHGKYSWVTWASVTVERIFRVVKEYEPVIYHLYTKNQLSASDQSIQHYISCYVLSPKYIHFNNSANHANRIQWNTEALKIMIGNLTDKKPKSYDDDVIITQIIHKIRNSKRIKGEKTLMERSLRGKTETSRICQMLKWKERFKPG